jgi:hypothetical protein
VSWRLKAHADIPWALDPTAEHKLQSEPSGTEDDFRVGDQDLIENNLLAADDDQLISWRGVLFGGLWEWACS